MEDHDLQASQTIQPQEAAVRVTTGASRELSEDERNDLAIDLFSTWDAVQNARGDMDENLRAYTSLYAMEVCELDEPWVGAANLVLPIIHAELDAMKAYVAGQVFVQRLIIVTPADEDPETARLAPLVEKFYNAELRRIRSTGRSPLDDLKDVLHLGLRDGTAPVDVLFEERKVPKLIVTNEVQMVDDNVVIDDKTGKPATKPSVTRVIETIAEVCITPRMLKEWYLVPAESTSIQSALGYGSALWMTEKEMKEKVESGIFDLQSVEDVLNWVVAGQSDVTRDRKGAYDKSARGQIDIGMAQGTLVSKFFQNRGPAKIIRLFSEQFDMNDDGIPERNIFWFYPDMPKLLGWAPYEYVSGEWPTFAFNPLPDPLRPYGFSLPELLADINAEANAGRNQRRNYIDMCLSPLLLEREGDSIRDKDRAFYPGARWTVEDVEKSLRWFTPNPLTSDSFQDESRLDTYVAKLTGQNAPSVGGQSSGRRTATEMRQQQAAQTVRSTDVAMDFRAFIRAVMQFWHKLNRQYMVENDVSATTHVSTDMAKAYGDEKGGELTLSPDILARNFHIEIAGLSDPVDAGSRRQEIMAALGVAFKAFPWIAQDPVLAYAWAEQFVDTFSWSSSERFIGTPEAAKERAEAMKQMAAQQQQQPPQPGAKPGPQGGGGMQPPAPNGAPAGAHA